ncbi:hypothetical protein TSAR_013801 [Trichomalopsis sarcophagae]|uniref:Uncharacterized protein n=1 Tax=Trichomalopsis sarcophagae TaxID=543379 RepID=A0A232F6F4_9HYME|nr:hypothetical protein TSAR_013801 [Trichomalopsis sarcophagae]
MRTATMESYGLSAENKKSTIALLADEVKDILSKNQVILLACWNNASTTTRKSSCRITDELSRDFIQARAQQHCGIRRHRHARKGRPCRKFLSFFRACV